MSRVALLAVLLALAGCTAVPYVPDATSPCREAEASYACQVERYHNVNVQ